MTITISFSSEEERRLRERAARTGLDVEAYIHGLIGRDLRDRAGGDEALAPFRRQVEESGLSDEELSAFFEEVRDEVWREKQGRAR